jgi:predicted RND superfamily exporter protein
VELTVGFESNLEKNVQRKKAKYSELIREQSEHSENVIFINIANSSLGVFSKECLTFMDMLNDLGFDKKHQNTALNE